MADDAKAREWSQQANEAFIDELDALTAELQSSSVSAPMLGTNIDDRSTSIEDVLLSLETMDTMHGPSASFIAFTSDNPDPLLSASIDLPPPSAVEQRPLHGQSAVSAYDSMMDELSAIGDELGLSDGGSYGDPSSSTVRFTSDLADIDAAIEALGGNPHSSSSSFSQKASSVELPPPAHRPAQKISGSSNIHYHAEMESQSPPHNQAGTLPRISTVAAPAVPPPAFVPPSEPAPVPPSELKQAYNPRFCAGCAKELVSGTVFSALERKWHPECFRCTNCLTVIASSQFLHKDFMPFCMNCRFVFNPRCLECAGPIEGPAVKLPESGALLHPTCYSVWSSKRGQQ